MMDYALFKTVICQRITSYLPHRFRHHRPSVQRVLKVNHSKDGFTLMPPEPQQGVAMPTFYLEDLYMEFSRDEDLEQILQSLAHMIVKWTNAAGPQLADFRLRDHTDCIAANLISTKLNQELLQTVPHRSFLDLSIIYRLVHRADDTGIGTAVIKTEMMEDASLTEPQLYAMAMKNMPRMFPPRRIEGPEPEVCVMTNEPGVCGASVMLYPQEMQRLARRLGGDYLIMPTSMHEFFAIAPGHMQARELARMLIEGNVQITGVEDFLTDSIYRYHAASGEIRIEVPGEGSEELITACCA